MKTWIALLRGINVGGNHIIPMKELRSLLESNGYQNVKTYIQSGNVVFQYDRNPGDEMGDWINDKYGFRPAIFMLEEKDLRKAAQLNPYQPKKGNQLHFFFCDQIPKSVDYELMESLKVSSEEYKLIDDVFYLHAPEGIGRSKLAGKIDKAFPDVTLTARNFNTINKLLGMIEP